MEQSGIQYAIIRDWDNIPESMSGGDLDLWIDKTKYDQVKDIIQCALVESEGCVVSFLDNLMVPKYTFLSANWGLQMDVCLTAVQYHCSNFLPEDFVQRNILRHNGYQVLSPKADTYLAFLKEVLNMGYCQKDVYVTNFKKTLEQSSDEEIHANLNVYSDDSIRMLQSQVVNDCKNDYHTLAKKLRGEILPGINLRYMRNQIMKCNRLFRHPGYMIAVLGTDGSGKSAIIGAITPWLDDAFHNGITYKHLRPGLLKDIAVVLGKRKADVPKQDVVANPHSGKQSGFIGSMLRLIYYLMDYLFGYFKLIWPQIVMHTKVFIFDRYYYDYYIDQRRSLINLPKWIIRVGELFVPKPDIILCLGGDPEKIYARKPETSLEEVARQTDELKRFAAKRKNAVWIDTTQPIEDSIRDAKTAILNMMSTRFKNVL